MRQLRSVRKSNLWFYYEWLNEDLFTKGSFVLVLVSVAAFREG